MTESQQRNAAKKFADEWAGKGYEKGESQKFWLQLLQEVLGVEDPYSFISFEDQVHLDHTSFIDGYIVDTHVLIEQKSADKDLSKPIRQSDGILLTPFQQAKRYSADLPYSKRPRWVVTCNFQQFYVYDMEQPHGEPQVILLKNLEKEYYRLSFLVNTGNEHLKKEMEVSLKAGEIVGLLYDALLKQYNDAKSDESLKSLNILCVRIVFCLYAEDAGVFGRHDMFLDYLKQYSAAKMRKALIELFEVLDTKIDDRDPYMDEDLKDFPYVNGGLFAKKNIEIPQFNDEIRDLLLEKASAGFDWSEISPTIFGAVFESTLNPETRRSGGMHYTSIENIHKVIDPLFMDELNKEFSEIKALPKNKSRDKRLGEFQDKISALTFLDPACGSGNFLTETYISLRKLENEALREIYNGQITLGTISNPIKVSIGQFYGIEINDFAVTVAKTALWIAESQMMKQTEDIVHMDLNFLPLKSYANIKEGNALRLSWTEWEIAKEKNIVIAERTNLYPTTELPATVASEPVVRYGEIDLYSNDVKLNPSKTAPETHFVDFDYIMGNPPFVGARLMSESQKEDVLNLFQKVKGAGNIDYVGCWYVKANNLMKGTHTKAALVSTNSITQGEQTAIIWKPLIENGLNINFAHRTFCWDSESSLKAHVHCVIIGFSYDNTENKTIYLNDSHINKANNINPYLIDAPNVFIESRKKPLCDVKEMSFGSMPNDSGNFILSEEEANELRIREPHAEKYIKLFLGADEFINNRKRYCLWLKDAEPDELRKMKLVAERVENVRKTRNESKREATKKLADTPWLFGEIRQPEEGTYLLIPRVSSERRKYIPVGFLPSDVIASDATQIIPEAGLYEFGIITSNVQNAWMRVVCGRLKSDYRYSANIVYNNFPWCNPSAEQRERIEHTAQAILDARNRHPQSSLADLYDETFMPADLRKAHQENDRAVMQAYGFSTKITESECVAELFKLYQKLTSK